METIATLKAEACVVCHDGAGGMHQSIYNSYTDASKLVLNVTDVGVTGAAAPYTVTLSFTVKKNGADVDPSTFLAKGFYISRWDTAAKEFRDGQISFTVAPTCPAGVCTATATTPFDPVAGANGVIFAKVAHDKLTIEPRAGRVNMYDNVGEDVALVGLASDFYSSAANVEGCEACHGKPYMKHGNIKARVEGAPDFASCKTCHFDDKVGEHFEWGMFTDDPYVWATVPDSENYTAEQKTKLAYNANLMNDVHMSHIMEFPYPQNGASCVTCHAGKLDKIFADTEFTAETCTSCHAIDGKDTWRKGTYMIGGVQTVLAADQKYYEAAGDGGRKRPPALAELWSEVDADGAAMFHEATDDCRSCHKLNGVAGQFTKYHKGYDPQIYDASGTRYTALPAYDSTITSVTKSGDKVKVAFTGPVGSKPMLAVGFYGYDTKDMLVSPHTGDGTQRCWSTRANRASGCTMEYTVGTNAGEHPNPLFVETAGAAGTWEVELDLASYVQPTATGLPSIPELIASGKVEKMEVSIYPSVTVGTVAVATKGASKTYDVTPTGAVETAGPYFKNTIADDADCNACHDALGTTFHGPNYGANGVAGCRNCHVPTSGGGHLEMQSRSIDSYVHAIHRFQAFDTSGIDFSDPVEAARYDLHVEHVFPLFTALACQGCHVNDPAKFNVPDQSKSMPGLLSASYTLDGRDRAIGTVNAQATGPGSRACGSCHRSAAINEDQAGELAAINAHVGQNGFMVDNTTANSSTTAWVYQVIDKMMSMF